jgi:hypothetical protein
LLRLWSGRDELASEVPLLAVDEVGKKNLRLY